MTTESITSAPGVASHALFGLRPYHEEAAVTIYHGDCRQIVPMLGRFDLLLTDPPYGIGIAANPVRQKHAKMEWDADVPDAWVLPMMLASASKAIVWGGNYFSLPPQQCFFAWDKMQPEDFSLAMLEQAWTNLKGPAKMFRKSVTSYAKEHPTQKPVELLQWCISRAGEVQTILDPFAGSGTTGEAAKIMGKKAVLIEREERYCEIAARRLAQDMLSLDSPNVQGMARRDGRPPCQDGLSPSPSPSCSGSSELPTNPEIQ
jgi:site-specific DNA-methyltransferase (adenine-specific)